MALTQSILTPAELFGPLFSAVQERQILGDGKAFVDAFPRRSAAEIMVAFDRFEGDDSALRHFVDTHFILPPHVSQIRATATSIPLREHIRAMWSALARDPTRNEASALAVRHRHVVPGGRFREIYYWDSFFTMIGLARDGEAMLATGIVDAMTDLIEEYGYVPNGTRTYYLGRSQPPLYYLMVALLDDKRPKVAARRLAAMKREHAWWMDGAETLGRGTQAKRVAMLADGSLLNRYWDPRDTPRDESWREDVETARASGRPEHDVYRDLRAGAESGWDFSSRWLGGPTLSTIRTTAIAPVDLNAFLFGLETAIAASGDTHYARCADRRRAAMHAHLWDDAAGVFGDYDLERETVRPGAGAAVFAPLLSGLASSHQAAMTAQFAEERLLAPGGLRTTLVDSGLQWDSPNGWAPLQWIAVAGLRRYGYDALAEEIAERWIGTVEATYDRTGLLFEKYDIETGSIGGGGEYATQIGFGWTNGVTSDFIDGRAVGHRANPRPTHA